MRCCIDLLGTAVDPRPSAAHSRAPPPPHGASPTIDPSADSRTERTFARAPAGTIRLAFSSVRLAVVPPDRKNRRRMAPRTTTSSPSARLCAAAGGFVQMTGTDSAGPPSARIVMSKANTSSPEAKTLDSGTRFMTARTITRLVPRATDESTVRAMAPPDRSGVGAAFFGTVLNEPVFAGLVCAGRDFEIPDLAGMSAP